MRHLIIICLLITLSVYLQPSFSDEDEEDDRVQLINTDFSIIKIEPQIQKRSGLKTSILNPVEQIIEVVAFGQALSFSPLLNQLNQYQIALADQARAKSTQTLIRKNRARNQSLYKNHIIATKTLQQQQSQWQSNLATWQQRQRQVQLIHHQLTLQWGEQLVQSILTEQTPLFDQLVHGNSTLVAINLPSTISVAHDSLPIWISATGHRIQAVKAFLLGQSPQADPLMQGLKYFFITNSQQIRPNMAITAWLPQARKISGVVIPRTAVIWHLGQPSVFIKRTKNQFEQRSLSLLQRVKSGYFTQQSIKAGEEIVTVGAQMLLSYAYRSQIPDEDD